jgi:glutamine amidotransferase of anthranilate synthase or aminodeoxychorismate synthase
VRRNDALAAEEALDFGARAIVLSPGPCDPDRAGICLDVVRLAAERGTPLLGVCLGHQTIGQALGGRVVRADEIRHGKTSPIRHCGRGLFEGLPQDFAATRYHSLVVERASLPERLEVTAETGDGVVMGLAARDAPLHGVQFHPESIASEHGKALLANFLRLAGPTLPAAEAEPA